MLLALPPCFLSPGLLLLVEVDHEVTFRLVQFGRPRLECAGGAGSRAVSAVCSVWSLLRSEIPGALQMPDPKELCATASPAHCSWLLLICLMPLHLQEQLDHPTG